MTERTLVLVKPDGVQRLLAGRIISRFEERGLKIFSPTSIAIQVLTDSVREHERTKTAAS